MCGIDIFIATIIESDKPQTTQHDDAIGGNVPIVHFGYQPSPPLQCHQYKPCKRLGSHMLPKLHQT